MRGGSGPADRRQDGGTPASSQPSAVAYAPYGWERRAERRHACGDARSGVRAPIALVAWRWRHLEGRHRTGQDVLASCTAAAPPQERTIGRPHPTYYYAATDAIDWLKNTPSSRRLIERRAFRAREPLLAALLVLVGSPVGSCPRQSGARRIGARPAPVARVARHRRRFRHLCSVGNVEPKDFSGTVCSGLCARSEPTISYRDTP